jgi:hypothetical protein
MKNFSTQAFLFILFFVIQMNAQAKIRIGATISGNKLTISYVTAANYNTSPINRWNSQVVTIRYPKTVEVNWSNLVNLSPFSFFEDPFTASPKDGGDGYYYKVFRASDVNLLLDLINTDNIPVFRMDVSANKEVTFEVSTSNVWTKSNNVETAVNNAGGDNVFWGSINLGNSTLADLPPTAVIVPLQTGTVTAGPVAFRINFSEPVSDFTESDLDVFGGSVSIQPTYFPDEFQEYKLVVTPSSPGSISIGLPADRVTDSGGNLNIASNYESAYYEPSSSSCLATYHLQELNDGYYQVSLIAGQNWSGTDAITATAQVTIKAGTSTSEIDSFNITDLQMLTPANWAQNSRYNAPAEASGYDYISFGLTSYGTTDIAYAIGDTVPLFKWKNTGICSEDSVYLMPITGDAFAYPNSLNANVGQQLSVSGHNEPDVPLCVEGVASCIAEVVFDLKALLQGPFVPAEGMMHDSLRVLGLIPSEEPYSNYEPIRGSNFAPFQHYEDGGSEYIDFGSIANDPTPIVDWILLELRSQHDSTKIISTRSAVVLRDGSICDVNFDVLIFNPQKGASGFNNLVVFKKLRSDKYYFTVRHRNHLGLMSEKAVPLVNTINKYDFTDPNTPMYGQHAGYFFGDKRLMWAGNSNADSYIMFQGGGVGQGLDIDNVFDNIFSDANNLNFSYNHVRNGYYPGDNNLDGRVKYQGPANDVDPFIFFNIISRHPDNTQKYINYYINEQLPK